MGYIRKALEKGYLEHPGSACCTDSMFEIFVFFWTVPVLLAGCFCQQTATMSGYKFTPRAVAAPDAPQQPLVRKRARSGGVWVKSGYSEAIPWRKVQLTKQRNVDLTTDGLWAMPLNTGWVPVKPRRLQDWEKLKKYVPSHKHGDVCPNGVPALAERGIHPPLGKHTYIWQKQHWGWECNHPLHAPSCIPTSNSMKHPLVRCGPYLSHILTSALVLARTGQNSLLFAQRAPRAPMQISVY